MLCEWNGCERAAAGADARGRAFCAEHALASARLFEHAATAGDLFGEPPAQRRPGRGRHAKGPTALHPSRVPKAKEVGWMILEHEAAMLTLDRCLSGFCDRQAVRRAEGWDFSELASCVMHAALAKASRGSAEDVLSLIRAANRSDKDLVNVVTGARTTGALRAWAKREYPTV